MSYREVRGTARKEKGRNGSQELEFWYKKNEKRKSEKDEKARIQSQKHK